VVSAVCTGMTVGSATTALAGGVALLERAMGFTLGGLLLVTPEAMSNPTPCAEWDLRALLLHMNESLRTLHEAISARHVDLLPGPGPDDGVFADPALDLVASLRTRGCQMIRAWTGSPDPGEITIGDCGLSPGIVAAAGAIEVAVHGWDVALACGQPGPVPPVLAGELLDLCRLLVDDGDRPSRFGAQVEVPPDASPSDRLVAFLGRVPPG
jgi:uncharacterized protein (TIGR03086 family)